MENFLSRYRNPVVLASVLLLQIIALAVQVKRPVDAMHPDAGSVRLIRLWVTGVITPGERVLHVLGSSASNGWHDYVNLGALRRENQALREENERLHIEQARISEDAKQAQRLQQLLDFQRKFIAATVAAQVIGTSGTEQSSLLYIDKGRKDGIRPDMAVIAPGGVVGKVRDVFSSTAQVLLINDPTSGVGAILSKSRLYGVAKGTATGGLMLDHVMTDEKVESNEELVTSGGDRIFPKGLPIGSVVQVSQGSDLFWNIRVKPATDLDRLEEVLIVTQMQGQQIESAEAPPVRAADILAQRLPGVTHRESTVPIDPGAAHPETQVPSIKPKVGVDSAPATPTRGQQNATNAVPAKPTGSPTSPAAVPLKTPGNNSTPPTAASSHPAKSIPKPAPPESKPASNPPPPENAPQ